MCCRFATPAASIAKIVPRKEGGDCQGADKYDGEDAGEKRVEEWVFGGCSSHLSSRTVSAVGLLLTLVALGVLLASAKPRWADLYNVCRRAVAACHTGHHG
jgi:hypothetical protein